MVKNNFRRYCNNRIVGIVTSTFFFLGIMTGQPIDQKTDMRVRREVMLPIKRIPDKDKTTFIAAQFSRKNPFKWTHISENFTILQYTTHI